MVEKSQSERSDESKKESADSEKKENREKSNKGKFGVAKRRFSLNRVMAKLPHTSQTAIAITFLVMNLSALLRQVLKAFFVLLLKSRLIWGSMINLGYIWGNYPTEKLIIYSGLNS